MRSRFGEHTPEGLRARLGALDAGALAELQAIPALLAYEHGHDQPARVARITRFFESARGDLRFAYEFVDGVPPVSAATLLTRADAFDVTRWEMNRTHWAVKDVDLWQALRDAGIAVTGAEWNAVRYDVALSFAGEQRDYVEQVAVGLRAAGVSVFYDGFEEADLWGKDLYVHLSDVYGKRARYTVMFISAAYAEKVWTNHERRAAQSRAFSESAASILPARFDQTNVAGVLPTTGYVDLTRKTPDQLVALILAKLGGPSVAATPGSGPANATPVGQTGVGETPAARAARLEAVRRSERAAAERIEGTAAVREVDAEVRRVFDGLVSHVAAVSTEVPGLPIRTGVAPDATKAGVRCGLYTVFVSWRAPYANSLRDAALDVLAYEGGPMPLPDEVGEARGATQRRSEATYVPDPGVDGSWRWRRDAARGARSGPSVRLRATDDPAVETSDALAARLVTEIVDRYYGATA